MPAENQQVNPSFSIKSNIDNPGAHLFVFAGGNNLSLAVLNAEHVFTDVSVYNFEPGITEQSKHSLLQDIFSNDTITSKNYRRTDIVWCTEQNIITPQSFFSRENSVDMVSLVYGDASTSLIKHELVLKHHVYNVYKVGTALEKIVTGKFFNATQWHQSSLVMNFESGKNDVLYCNFTPGTVTVMLRKQKQLQVVQSFEYNTATDAVFHLLNVCRCYDIDAATIPVVTSGMIDEASSLYTELFKYFSAINFLKLPAMFGYSNEIENHPAHYFSHLFTTAACVL